MVGRYEEALKVDDAVSGDMHEHYESGGATTQLFCVAVVHKALAYAGLGREDDALWYWNMAISLYPAIARSDMSDYGAAGEFIKRHTSADGLSPHKAGNVTPPKVLHQVQTHFPNASLNVAVEGPVTIEVIVGRDGKPHAPRVIDTLGAPMLAYAMGEALRE